MNYGRNNTSRRRLKLQAKAAKRRRKPELRSYKTVLLVLLGIGILGLLTGGLLFKSIIDRAPKITDDSLKPSAYITTVYANDGTTELGTFVSSGSNRVYKKLDQIPKDLQERSPIKENPGSSTYRSPSVCPICDRDDLAKSQLDRRLYRYRHLARSLQI